MRRLLLIAGLAVTGCSDPAEPAAGQASAPAESAPTNYEQLWTTTERAARRTCPSTSCGVVGQLMFRESAHVYERRDDWARITEPYPASCNGGSSEHVDTGDARCVEDNGIVDGRFAEWVRLSELSQTRPAHPADTATADERLVAQSDDFAQHREAFVGATATLIQQGRCTAADFEEQGGWIKSSNHPDKPIYFTYCGGMTVGNRIYLDAQTGRLF